MTEITVETGGHWPEVVRNWPRRSAELDLYRR